MTSNPESGLLATINGPIETRHVLSSQKSLS